MQSSPSWSSAYCPKWLGASAKSGTRRTYELGELDRLAPAYATTVHKAQGSEYPAVVVPLTMRHYPMLRRNLIYTAVTRARRLLVLVGERRALAVAVKGRRVERRWTRLRELMAGASS